MLVFIVIGGELLVICVGHTAECPVNDKVKGPKLEVGPPDF